MTECTCCHECANSQSQFSKMNNAPHGANTRCGDNSQGEGGGINCAAVIDSFIAERETNIKDGIKRCEGHCGPILEQGCRTFFWVFMMDIIH